MKLLQRGVALALLTTFTLASETALAYEQDKTYKITVLHTNDHHGHFWRNEYGDPLLRTLMRPVFPSTHGAAAS